MTDQKTESDQPTDIQAHFDLVRKIALVSSIYENGFDATLKDYLPEEEKEFISSFKGKSEDELKDSVDEWTQKYYSSAEKLQNND